jgi:general secretion pathway protein C
MLLKHPNLWQSRAVTFLLAATAAASVAYWVLKWPAPNGTLRTTTAEPSAPPIDSAKVAQLLGANPVGASAPTPSVAAASRYKLIGVIAQGQQSGSALIAIDGQPAKPYRVGDAVGDDLVLRSVKAKGATLGASKQGAGSVTLELPPLPGTP